VSAGYSDQTHSSVYSTVGKESVMILQVVYFLSEQSQDFLCRDPL